MAFKTKEQIFGDNGVNGLQVPISVSNPPGTAAANRGVGFGEGVTAAIANRAAYELAKNDEDVNARIADFETAGLDSAYRGGLSATPGSGRVISIDGGAVDLQDSGATGDEANALLRARLAPGGGSALVGVDVVGEAFGAVFHRVPLALNNNTVLPLSTAAVLNPAGAGADIVEVTGPQMFAAAGLTDLIIGFDFLSITGTANNDGLYAIGAILTDFRVQVFPLNGALPGFAPSLAAAVTLHRSSTRAEDGSLLVGPLPGSPGRAAFDAVSDPDGLSADYVFRASMAATDGSTSPVFEVSRDGATRITQDNAARSAAEIRQLLAAPLFVDAQSTRTDSSSAPVAVMKFAGLDYLNGVPAVPGAPLTWPELVIGKYNFAFSPPNPVLHDLPVAVNLVAATNFIEFQAAGKPLTVGLFGPNTMVELTGTTGGAYDGFYHVVGHNQSAGNGQVHLSTLSGASLSFPADTATARVYAASRRHLVGIPTISYTYDPATPPHADIFDAVKSFDVNHSFNGSVFVEGPFVIHEGTSATTPANRNGSVALFAVDGAGNVFMKDTRITGSLDVIGGPVTLDASDLRFLNAPDRAVRAGVLTGETGWTGSSGGVGQYTSSAAGAGVWFDFVLPHDVELISINASVTPVAARPIVGNRMTISCQIVATDTLGTRTAYAVSGTTADDGTTNPQLLTRLAASIPSSIVGLGTDRSIRVWISAGTAVAGDYIDDVFLVVKSDKVK